MGPSISSTSIYYLLTGLDNMKKIISFVFGLALVLPVAASAASFVVSPSSGSYTVGDSIVLTVSANPVGSTIYTAMLDARFSSDTFEVSSFTLNDSLLPLKQSGYDALNNASGVLTKTGGFTGGITSTASFGVIVLRAKAAGTGTFTVVDTSKLLDSNNTDQQSGTQTASFAIAPKPVAQAVPVQTTQTPSQSTTKQTETKQPTTKSASVANATGTPATSTQVAAAATTGMSPTLTWILWLLSVIVAFGVGYFAGFRKRGY